MIHLYALVPAGTALPATAGVGGVGLRACEAGGLVAVVSDAPAVPLDAREAAVAHGLVVEALREAADAVLPVRFGECFGSDAELVAAVAEQAPGLHRRLEWVRGCSEFGVRVLTSGDCEEDRAPAPDGTAYLRARLAERRRALALTDALHRPLARYARATTAHTEDGGSTAYLVESARRAAFERTVARLAAEHPEATVVCTGPWAPYSFAGDA